MDEHLKSDHKDSTVDDFLSFVPHKLISEFNADKANDAFGRHLNKRQQENFFNNKSQQQLLSHIGNYYAQMH